MLCVFDAVGTLLAPRRPVAEIYQEWGARHQLVHEIGALEPRVRAAITREIWSETGGPTSEFRERLHWRRVVASVFGTRAKTRALFRDLWAYFADPVHWQVFADVAGCLQTLADQGVQLAIASNFDSRLPTLVRGLPPLARIERIFVSSDIGWRKPDRRFFETIARQCSGQSPVWMIGDRLELDVLPARAVGWQAVWLRRTRGPEVRTYTPTIDSLEQLPQLVFSPTTPLT